ncbi:non-specific lipid-transfer protein-like protein At5g64080 isoform X2 [Cucurbita pepo subsp. pepo]|uniref:non-specific lipid-transfer protein-like protein At5g64080 isoform X2 n=1 Tax=Cucurbita pepo subsp. pepo TaxID=3664 RepID=UPI000C9D5606|nr:non-specific lipid-transfer protein-like protein At5g64080 isoform X2 [Cucurbita pepo subsp. pepo]
MATAKLSLSLFALFALVANYSAAYGALVPEGDCSKLILTLADCLPFVSKDSTTTTPAKACCLGLKIVAKANADCLCHTFKKSASLGIVLNVTKALSLPAACDISDPALSECKLSTSPIGSPVTPAASPKLSPGEAPVKNETTPAPTPETSAATGVMASVGSIVAAIGVGVFYSF